MEVCRQKTDITIQEAVCEWKIARPIFEAIKDPVTLTSKKFMDPNNPEIKWRLKLFETKKNLIQCCALCYNIPQNMNVFLKASLTFGENSKPIEQQKFSKCFLIFKVDMTNPKKFEKLLTEDGYVYIKIHFQYWLGHSAQLLKAVKEPAIQSGIFYLQDVLKDGNTVPFDCTLVCKGKFEVKVHKVVLKAASPTFRCILATPTTSTIFLTEFDVEVVQNMIHFLYGEETSATVLLFQLAHKFEIEDLMAYCIPFLVSMICDMTVMDLFYLAMAYEITDLKIKCADYLKKNFLKVIANERFKELPAERIKEVLDELSDMQNNNEASHQTFFIEPFEDEVMSEEENHEKEEEEEIFDNSSLASISEYDFALSDPQNQNRESHSVDDNGGEEEEADAVHMESSFSDISFD